MIKVSRHMIAGFQWATLLEQRCAWSTFDTHDRTIPALNQTTISPIFSLTSRR